MQFHGFVLRGAARGKILNDQNNNQWFPNKTMKKMLQNHYYHSLQNTDIMMKIMSSIPPNEWCALLRQGHLTNQKYALIIFSATLITLRGIFMLTLKRVHGLAGTVQNKTTLWRIISDSRCARALCVRVLMEQLI